MVSSRRGFTLVELLIVVVILGILASIAIPKFKNTKEKSYIAAMKSDLRNLSVAEEGFFYDSSFYTANTAELTLLRGYNPTADITVVINEASPKGWSASATHARTSRQCFYFWGSATPVGNATVEGRITCN